MKNSKTWLIQVKTISEANCSQHWSVKRKRHKMQQNVTYYSMMQNAPELMQWAADCRPHLHIKLSRCEPKLLDGDNLPSSMKWITDQIADYFFPNLAKGQADSQKGISFEYDQVKTFSKEDRGVLITIDWET